MKILILNWRDPKSPLEGGAERFTKKYGEFWASLGHEVFWLTNSFVGGKDKEVIEGINYIRISPALSGTLLSYLFNYPIFLFKSVLFAHNFIKKENVSLVIDEIHGLPFFTPLYSKARNVLLTCEVAGPIWDKMFPFPINIIGKTLEKFIYQIYRNTEIWAISDNTKNNILELLSGKKIKVIDLGVDENKEILAEIKDVKKTTYPSAVFLARLVKMKGIETAIEATAEIVKVYPGFKLFVVGDGEEFYKKFLFSLVTSLKISKNVVFLGKLSEIKKYEYLKKAHFLFHPSYKEGFGLTVLEAGLVGTPSLIRKGSSLDALVAEGKTGYKFESIDDILYITKNILGKNYSKLSNETNLYAKKRTWEAIFAKASNIL